MTVSRAGGLEYARERALRLAQLAEGELDLLPPSAAREALREDELLCVSGSFYLAGIARRVLREVEPQIRTPEPAPRV